MYNTVLTTIDAVKDTIQNAYSEHDWLLIVLKNGGWADNTIAITPAVRATVGTIEINELVIIARRETLAIATPTLNKIKITVDFRVAGYDGLYSTVERLKYPTEEDIRAALIRLNLYAGYNIVAPIALKL